MSVGNASEVAGSSFPSGPPYLGKQRLKSQYVDFLLHTLLQPVGYRVLGEEAGKLASQVPRRKDSQLETTLNPLGICHKTFYLPPFPQLAPTLRAQAGHAAAFPVGTFSGWSR